MSEHVAELAEVTKSFGGRTALEGVSLRLRGGELTALLGPNGAGKSTAVRLLLGMTRPTRGRALVFGKDPTERAARLKVGALLQLSRLPDTLTPREHLTLFRSYYPTPRPLDELLEVTGLGAAADRRYGVLSGGQKQRALFAVALCGDPELLFLDEPTVGMDLEARGLLWNEVRRLVGRGRAVLLTTHDLAEADALADRVVVLNRGRVSGDGTSAQVKQRVAARRVRCVTSLSAEAISARLEVQSVRPDGAGLVVLTRDAEALARWLLAEDARLSELEISAATLEEAFVALTELPPSLRDGEARPPVPRPASPLARGEATR